MNILTLVWSPTETQAFFFNCICQNFVVCCLLTYIRLQPDHKMHLMLKMRLPCCNLASLKWPSQRFWVPWHFLSSFDIFKHSVVELCPVVLHLIVPWRNRAAIWIILLTQQETANNLMRTVERPLVRMRQLTQPFEGRVSVQLGFHGSLIRRRELSQVMKRVMKRGLRLHGVSVLIWFQCSTGSHLHVVHTWCTLCGQRPTYFSWQANK